jgi:hypothetical protein
MDGTLYQVLYITSPKAPRRWVGPNGEQVIYDWDADRWMWILPNGERGISDMAEDVLHALKHSDEEPMF